MAGVTSVPGIEFTSVGLVVPTDAQILAGVQADQNAAFGGNLNPSLSTPQGQLATSDAAIISQKNSEFLAFVSGIDPATSDGAMQDAICRIYFLDRLPAESTTVPVICSGKTGVTIPAGSLVQDANGNIYASVAAGVIPGGGTVTVFFDAVVVGPIECPPGSIVTIYQNVFGWDSVSNAVAGTPGRLVESRADFEYRRKQSVALNANGSVQAVYGNVINVDGVTDCYVTENRLNSSVVIDGVTLTAHSIYAAAVGGANLDVATAIFNKAGSGATYIGNTTVAVQDGSGYASPVPTYDVKFQRPADLQIYFATTVQNLSGLPNATVEAAIQTAIVAAFAGQDGGQKARIGATIFATRYILPMSLAAAVAILALTVGSAPSPVGASQAVGIDDSPKIQSANIAVTFI